MAGRIIAVEKEIVVVAKGVKVQRKMEGMQSEKIGDNSQVVDGNGLPSRVWWVEEKNNNHGRGRREDI